MDLSHFCGRAWGVSLLVSIIKDTVPPRPRPLLSEENQHLLPVLAPKVALSHRAPANPSHTAQVIKTFSASLPAPHTPLTEVASGAAGKHSRGVEVWGATAPCWQLPHSPG